MNLSAIGASLGFKGSLPKLPNVLELAKYDRCPKCGLDHRLANLEKTPEEDIFEPIDSGKCPEGQHFDYTEDNRKIVVPNHRG